MIFDFATDRNSLGSTIRCKWLWLQQTPGITNHCHQFPLHFFFPFLYFMCCTRICQYHTTTKWSKVNSKCFVCKIHFCYAISSCHDFSKLVQYKIITILQKKRWLEFVKTKKLKVEYHLLIDWINIWQYKEHMLSNFKCLYNLLCFAFGFLTSN